MPCSSSLVSSLLHVPLIHRFFILNSIKRGSIILVFLRRIHRLISFRVYKKEMRTIICYYHEPSLEGGEAGLNQLSNLKRIYLLVSVILRIVVPFLLLLTANIVLFVSVRRSENQTRRSESILLVRHGHHRKITPMIFFSSCMLLLTITPR